MVILDCLYSKIVDCPTLDCLEVFSNYINPIDFEFPVEVGVGYYFVGLIYRDCTKWIYAFSINENIFDISLYPAILFDVSKIKLSNNYISYIDSNGMISIIHKELSNHNNWFEDFINEDEKIINILNNIILTK